MSDFIIGVIQGIVEGLTEFLPVSSTGHLILSGHLIGFTGERAETFEVFIQLGAILAVAVLYWRRLLELMGFSGKDTAGSNEKRLTIVHVFIAIIPAMVLGVLLHGVIKQYLFAPSTVLIGLVAGGIFMIFAEKKQTVLRAKTIDDLSYKQVFQIGIAQCLALWPGFSRSGATIAGGMLSGASLRASANFSFLIAIPMMVAAGGYDLLKSWKVLQPSDFELFATGFIVSFIVAMLAVVSFLKLLEKVRFTTFAYYRFGLAAVFLVYMIWSG